MTHTYMRSITILSTSGDLSESSFCPRSPLGEDDILIDPSELLGRRLDFQLVLKQCWGLHWIREEHSRGAQIG